MPWLVNILARIGAGMVRALWPFLQRLGVQGGAMGVGSQASVGASLLSGIGLGFLLDDDNEEVSTLQAAYIVIVTLGVALVVLLLVLGWKSLKRIK